MKLKRISTLLPALAAAFLVSAQNGSTAYNFLNVTSSAKIYGLGGVNITLVDDDISVADQNPSLLGPEMSNMVGMNYMHYIGGSNFAGARYAHSAGERGAWSAGIQYFGYGSIKETTPDGQIVGSISPKDITFGGQYAHDFSDRLRGGIALKGIYSSYAEFSAFALSTDLGINYFDSDKDLSLSLVLANLGGQVKRFNETYDRLPFDVRLGWSQSFGSFPLRFSITAWNLTKWHLPFTETGDGTSESTPVVKDKFMSNLFRHLVFGVDLISSPNYYISLGYNYETRTDMSTYSRSFLSGFSLGAGLKVKSLGVSLAFAQPHSGATTFMVNLSYNFNDLIR